MSLQSLCAALTVSLERIVTGQREAREDCRAFGAMLEKVVADAWPTMCAEIGATPQTKPGRRSIYDVACRHDNLFVGVDVVTTDLDPGRYSDGGVCSVENLLRFLANDGGQLLVCEIAHRGFGLKREICSITVAPLHALPVDAIRIENLGSGQVRLDDSLANLSTRLDWHRPVDRFLDAFVEVANAHYRRVIESAQARIDGLARFRARSFTEFSSGRRA